MKKLLSILASLGLGATAATAVVSCSTSVASIYNAVSDEDGNVTFELKNLIMDQDFKDINAVMARYSVFWPEGSTNDDGKSLSGTSLNNISFTAKDKNVTKFKQNHGYDFTVTFSIGDDYESNQDYKFKLATVKGTNSSKPGTMGAPIRTIYVGKSTNHGPNYVGWTGGDKGVANMGDPKSEMGYVTDGKGFYEGYGTDGKDAKISVNKDGYPVDTTGNKEDDASGYGKRIAVTKDSDGKYKNITGACPAVGDNDSNSKIYLDNDGYRIAYDKTANNGNGGWIRVSADGKYKLGPNSTPNLGQEDTSNSGNKVWIINDDEDTSSIAPYKTINKDGTTTYLDKNGRPIYVDDKDGHKPGDAIVNANGRWTSNNHAAKYTTSEDKGSDVTDGTSPNADDAKSAATAYKPIAKQSWTLNGNVDIKLGKNVKDKGTITVGDDSKDGSVTLKPSDPDSHQWHTIPSGKYAGMQVRVSEDGKQVEFQWPLTDKQISDISAGSTDSDSPVTKDKDSGNLEINVPLKFTDGEKPITKDVPSGVKITTPWDPASTKDAKEALDWWIDAAAVDYSMNVDNFSAGNKIRINLSKTLADKLKSEKAIEPTISGANKDKLRFIWDKKNDNYNVNDDNYIEGTLSSTLTANDLVNLDGNKPDTWPKAEIDFSSCFGDAQQLKGTANTSTISFVSASGSIDFNKRSVNIDDQNYAYFDVSDISSADIDYSNVDVKIGINDGPFEDSNDALENSGKPVWDMNTKSLSAQFKDGVLSKDDQVKFEVQFYINGHQGDNSLIKPIVLTALKIKATKSETNIDVVNSTENVMLNGLTAEIDFDNLGPLISKEKDKKPTVHVISTKGNASVTDSIFATDSWLAKDGKTWALKISMVGDDIIPNNEYTLQIGFDLDKGFGTKKINNIVVSKDDHKNAKITQDGQQDKELDFGDSNKIVLNISAAVPAAFDVSKIKQEDSVLNLYDSNKKKLLEGKGGSFEWGYSGGKLTITLNNELPKQINGLTAYIKLGYKDGTNGVISLNPTSVIIKKDQAAKKWSAPVWEQTKPAVFDDKTVQFNLNTHSDSEDPNNNALSWSDINYDSFNIKDGELVGTSPDNTQKVLKEGIDFTKEFDKSNGTLIIKLSGEVYKDNYSFVGTFDLANGYSGTREMPEVFANKEAPLSADFDIDVTPVEENGVKLDSLDNNATAEFKVTTTTPDNVDLNNESGVKAMLADPNASSNGIVTDYDSKEHILKIHLADKTEIPGGKPEFVVSFNARNAKDGYDTWNLVKSKPFKVTKKEPTPGFTTVTWKGAENNVVNFTMAADKNEADYSLDKDAMKKTGVDLSFDKATKVEMSDGDWNKPEVLVYDEGAKQFKANDGTTATYVDGQLRVIFPDTVMSNSKLHLNPRQFKVFLGVGNGYENSKFATEDHPDGFDGGIILKATKGFATTAEKQIVVVDSDKPQNFNDTNKTTDDGKLKETWHEGIWQVSKVGDQIDLNNPQSVVITNTSDPDGAPYEPSTINILPPKDKDSDPTIDPKSPKKDPNKNGKSVLIADEKNGSGQIKLDIKDGALWKGDYSVKITYKLKDYDETVDVTLKFSKTEANDNEKAVETAPGSYFVNHWHHVKGTIVDPNGLRSPSKYFVETQITFKEFGGAVDCTTPKVKVFKNDGTTPYKDVLGNSLDNKFFYFSTKQNPEDGTITLIFRCWQMFLIGKETKSDYPKFEMTFGLATFGGTSKTIKFDWQKDAGAVIEN